ncbi:MAG: putative manganese-dependent inorganic diphosphatase [Planctomycetota bacterium]|nr:putative manganese-dependent inorganic diphosphatase [Planctomycetota bacterium]
MTTYVFGHRNPDTDAICSALAYADFLQRTSQPDAVAACCGTPNQRTEFALSKARLTAPRMIMDVRPEVAHVCRTDPVVAYDDEVFQEVYERMKERNIGAAPVLDRQQRFVGMITLLDLLKVIFEGDDDARLSRRIHSSVDKVCSVLQGTLQHSEEVEGITDFNIMVGAMSAEGFTQRLHQFEPSELLVVSGNRPTIQLPALEHKVRVLVVTGGYDLSPGLLQLAKLNGTTVISSQYDTATTTMRIKSARRIDSAIHRDCLTLSPKLPVEDARKLVERSPQRLFPVLDDQGCLYGVLSKSDLISPPKTKLILVDHNELSQAVMGADESDIIEVLDHHRLGGSLRSDQPIRFHNEPVGSTCTLVANKFRGSGIDPTPGIALCMASGIISDTLNLRSPTTTEVDKIALQWLGEKCSVDLDEFVQEFFAVGSSLRTQAAAKVVREDCKQFEDRGHVFSISQIEEIGYDLFWERKNELHEALLLHTSENNLDFAALFVTDIITNGSMLLMSHEPEFWESANYPNVERYVYELENVVSRKKQLLPLFSQLLENAQVALSK